MKEKEIRGRLIKIAVFDKFDKVVFESIVEKIIIGKANADESIASYKLTFVLKELDNRVIPNAKNRYLNLNKKLVDNQSAIHLVERMFDRNNHDYLVNNKK